MPLLPDEEIIRMIDAARPFAPAYLAKFRHSEMLHDMIRALPMEEAQALAQLHATAQLVWVQVYMKYASPDVVANIERQLADAGLLGYLQEWV